MGRRPLGKRERRAKPPYPPSQPLRSVLTPQHLNQLARSPFGPSAPEDQRSVPTPQNELQCFFRGNVSLPKEFCRPCHGPRVRSSARFLSERKVLRADRARHCEPET